VKKFYKLVTIQKENNLYKIHLDGKIIKTPSGGQLSSDNKEVAEIIMEEWASQTDVINPKTMPVTQIITTFMDRVSKERDAMHDLLVAYFNTDLICYHAPDPPEMKNRQEKEWGKWLDWFEQRYNHKLDITYGLSAIKQADDINWVIDREVRNLSDINFTLLQLVTSISGSIILGLAFIYKSASPEDIFNATNVEESIKAEIYNEAFYGKSPTQEKQANTMIRDLNAAKAILDS